MDEFGIDIASTTTAREAALNVSAAKSALSKEEVLAVEVLDTVNGLGAAMSAVLRKSDATVSARLTEWQVERPGRLHMMIKEEKEGFPPYRLAPLSILKILTPTDDHVSLLWRDQSRFELAKAGELDVALRAETVAGVVEDGTQGNDTNQTTDRPEAPASREKLPEKVKERSERTTKKDDETEVRRLKLLVDRNPGVQVQEATSRKFMKVFAAVVEGMKGAIYLKAYGPEAERLSSMLSDALAREGAAHLTVDVKLNMKSPKKNEFYLKSLLAIEPTKERIQFRNKTSDASKEEDSSHQQHQQQMKSSASQEMVR